MSGFAPGGRARSVRRVRRAAGLLLLWGISASLSAEVLESAQPRVLDRFADLTVWSAAASSGARASIAAADGVAGRALRLDFDFAGTAGYANASRALPLELPENYEISFWLRADAPVNDLQFKLVDEGGDNVWWFHRHNFEYPREWRQIRVKKRQIEFAWGPAADHELRRMARVELVVAAGRGGGAGTLYISDIEFRALAPDPVSWPPPSAVASSYLPGAEPPLAVDGNAATAWQSDPAAGAAQTITLDFGRERDFGGLFVRWRDGAFASSYDVQTSDDGDNWQTLRSVTAGSGGRDALLLPDAQARYLRLRMLHGPMENYGIAEIEVKDPAFGASPNAFFGAVARDARRGFYPRGFSGEQPYWTVVGVDGGLHSGLLSEDGALEAGSGGFSIEPFMIEGSSVVTWADVTTSQSLAEGYLPLPAVDWQHGDWRLRVSAIASGTRERPRLIAHYELANVSDHPVTLKLVLAVRPLQVNPPAQFLSVEGGVSGVRDIDWNGAALVVNGQRNVLPLRPPDCVGMAPFDAGPVPAWAAAGEWRLNRRVHDDFGYASAALEYDFTLAAGSASGVSIVVPLSEQDGAALDFAGKSPEEWLAAERESVASAWRTALNRVTFEVPAEAQPVIDTLRTALSHVLIVRDGPILRPGPRSYARSWIRDGAMMSESLLRLAHANDADSFLRWYAPHQFADGRMPCCIDARGADPVPENDSDGEFLFLVNELYRYTRDDTLRTAMWPHVVAAMRNLESLRQSGRTPENRDSSFYGLVPASISHEGYSAKPMHSYWDDFWVAKGYAAAVDLARAQGAAGLAAQWEASRRELERDLRASLRVSTTAHRIAFVPGAAELGDFDPTSTTIAFAPGATVLDMAMPAVAATYARYWQEFVDRRDGRVLWREYTPYELRNVGVFVRLGWEDRAQQLLDFFLDGRRPQAWNQWAEVVGRNYRQPRFIGDMPHGWVASDFMRAVLDMFAYERDADRSMVLARGVPESWIEGRGVAVRGLRTPYGKLSYTLRREKGDILVLRVDAESNVPPGGFVLVAPDRNRPPAATVNGRRAHWRDGELRIALVPASVAIDARSTRRQMATP